MENPNPNVNAQGQAASLAETGGKLKKALDRAGEVLRLRQYSICTEDAYIAWRGRYILFHSKRHQKDMGPAHIEAFLSHLAIDGNVCAATRNQAFNVLFFGWGNVLDISLEGEAINAARAASGKISRWFSSHQRG
jgi:hypothetical protein